MAYIFKKDVFRQRVRDGSVIDDKWKTRVTVTVIMTDDADPDFKPVTREVSGYPTSNAGLQAMGVDLVNMLNATITAYEAEKALVQIEEIILGGKILDKIDTYLIANVGV